MASNRHGNKKSSLARLEAVGDQLKSQVTCSDIINQISIVLHIKKER